MELLDLFACEVQKYLPSFPHYLLVLSVRCWPLSALSPSKSWECRRIKTFPEIRPLQTSLSDGGVTPLNCGVNGIVGKWFCYSGNCMIN